MKAGNWLLNLRHTATLGADDHWPPVTNGIIGGSIRVCRRCLTRENCSILSLLGIALQATLTQPAGHSL